MKSLWDFPFVLVEARNPVSTGFWQTKPLRCRQCELIEAVSAD